LVYLLSQCVGWGLDSKVDLYRIEGKDEL
jgi:hypothetical protein